MIAVGRKAREVLTSDSSASLIKSNGAASRARESIQTTFSMYSSHSITIQYAVIQIHDLHPLLLLNVIFPFAESGWNMERENRKKLVFTRTV